jgi:exopolysaccharide production protein ExoQ
MTLIATAIILAGILGLFWLDRDRASKTSWALWLPIAWLLIVGSRHVSAWLGTSPVGSPDQYMEGSPVDRNIYALLLVAAIAVLVGRRAAIAKIVQKNWPIVLFVVYCAISVLWSDYPDVALKRWVKSLGDYAMVLIVLTERDRAHALKRVLASVGFVLLPLSVLFIKYYPDLGRAYATRWSGTQFFVGVASDKNMLGMVCLVLGFGAAWRALEAWRGPRRQRNKTLLVHGTILAMAIWLLNLSDSKTSLSCFVATTALIAVHMFVKAARKRVVVNAMVAVVVLSSFSVLFLGIGGGVLQSMGRNPTLTGRTEIWENLLKVPINRFLGTGFESFWLGERLERLWTIQIVAGINEAHNGYLETYLNLGWIGVTFLAVLIWTGYKNVLRLLEKDPVEGRLRLGFFVIVVVYNFTEAAFRSTDLVWIAFLFAVVALPINSPARAHVASPRPMTSAVLEVEELLTDQRLAVTERAKALRGGGFTGHVPKEQWQ